jgi:hypothetical protein
MYFCFAFATAAVHHSLFSCQHPAKQLCIDHTALSHTVLCCAVLCCAVLCCAVLCCAVLCCAVLCCAVLCCAVLCCGLQSLDWPCEACWFCDQLHPSTFRPHKRVCALGTQSTHTPPCRCNRQVCACCTPAHSVLAAPFQRSERWSSGMQCSPQLAQIALPTP